MAAACKDVLSTGQAMLLDFPMSFKVGCGDEIRNITSKADSFQFIYSCPVHHD